MQTTTEKIATSTDPMNPQFDGLKLIDVKPGQGIPDIKTNVYTDDSQQLHHEMHTFPKITLEIDVEDTSLSLICFMKKFYKHSGGGQAMFLAKEKYWFIFCLKQDPKEKIQGQIELEYDLDSEKIRAEGAIVKTKSFPASLNGLGRRVYIKMLDFLQEKASQIGRRIDHHIRRCELNDERIVSITREQWGRVFASLLSEKGYFCVNNASLDHWIKTYLPEEEEAVS